MKDKTINRITACVIVGLAVWFLGIWWKGLSNTMSNMSNIIVEIRAAEGGEDAKLLVVDQFRAYYNAARRNCL